MLVAIVKRNDSVLSIDFTRFIGCCQSLNVATIVSVNVCIVVVVLIRMTLAKSQNV